ncbi:hypothetical protein LCGC14_1225620 [marine sediment metagenome]|uniref:Uncharacterized protein n=1 Tax=marine sediment metagenome TaxID=412755 RepID=A0A0F9LA21_9ZZZZ
MNLIADKITETKPRYELKRRSKNYVGLYEGDHCLAAICTKRTRGVLDAQLLLLVMNSHKDLLDCLALFVGQLQQPGSFITPQDIDRAATAIDNAKPK